MKIFYTLEEVLEEYSKGLWDYVYTPINFIKFKVENGIIIKNINRFPNIKRKVNYENRKTRHVRIRSFSRWLFGLYFLKGKDKKRGRKRKH